MTDSFAVTLHEHKKIWNFRRVPVLNSASHPPLLKYYTNYGCEHLVKQWVSECHWERTLETPVWHKNEPESMHLLMHAVRKRAGCIRITLENVLLDEHTDDRKHQRVSISA